MIPKCNLVPKPYCSVGSKFMPIPVWRVVNVKQLDINQVGVKNTNPMKTRLILMGCIISALGIILLIENGYSEVLIGLLVVGVILLVSGLLWNGNKQSR